MLSPFQGWGLGLRTQHYPDFLKQRQPLDWLEVITDNYLGDGGRPLKMLDQIRQDYPVVMHGVAMSIGRASGINVEYVKRVKRLADRINPLWISDHLCWTAPPGSAYLHDLYPLPYTEESARVVIEHISQVQDLLQQRFVVENVSSYISYRQSGRSEWEFLNYIAQEADCLLLVDVNNVYVSSVNHDFDAMDYLRGLPKDRVQQFHLAGHSVNAKEDLLIDTHDQPVPQAVWDLYAKACQVFGPVPSMIERDDHIPELSVLLEEVAHGRRVQEEALKQQEPIIVAQESGGVDKQHASSNQVVNVDVTTEAPEVVLSDLQSQLGAHILERDNPQAIVASIESNRGVEASERLRVYHYAYRSRLAEILADIFTHTVRYMGGEAFEKHATEFVVENPPNSLYLGQYGVDFPDWLAQRYPEQLQLSELARIEWLLQGVFDAADQVCLRPEALGAGADEQENALRLQQWLDNPKPLQATVQLHPVTTNAAAIWREINADEEVEAPQKLPQTQMLMVWRHELQPHFLTLSERQSDLMGSLLSGLSLNQAVSEMEPPPEQEELGQWLQQWLHDGVFLDCFQSQEKASLTQALSAQEQEALDSV